MERGFESHSLRTLDNNGCATTNTLDITIHDKIAPNFTYNTENINIFENNGMYADSIFTNSSILFTNTTFENVSSNIFKDNYTFMWDFEGETSFNETSFNPSYTYNEAGKYIVQLNVVDKIWGCKSTISKPIHVLTPFSCNVKFPNAFTPALSSNNEFFSVYKKGISTANYELSVYNRWGELLWHTNNCNESWNGVYKGEIVKQDVYVYKCKAVCNEIDPTIGKQREIFINGDVTVLR